MSTMLRACFILAAVPFCSSYLAETAISRSQTRPSSTFLLGRRRTLASVLAEHEDDDESGGGFSAPVRKPTKKQKNQSKKKTKKGTASVSPALAEWAATSGASAKSNPAPSKELSSATTFEEKKGGRVRQKERMERDKQLDKAAKEIVKELKKTLEEGSNNLDAILSVISKFVQQQTPQTSVFNLKAMTSKSVSSDDVLHYRLAWVGSDKALCHVGTGLHKVPLARMQEVFLSLEGRNRLEMFEVISIFGPFPNVRNTLQGKSQVRAGIETAEWTVTWDSMVDGAGKELLAGGEAKARRVNLQLCFADTNAVVAAMPTKDAMGNKGENLLVFVAVEDLDSELEKLRVL